MELDATRVAALERTLSEEADCARQLTQALCAARAATARMNAQGLDHALAEAAVLAEALNRKGQSRSRLASEAARVLGLPSDAPLTRVVAAMGDTSRQLGQTVSDLQGGLEALARESAALGVCTRYGAGVVGHRYQLSARQTSYGPFFSARTAGRTV